MSNSIAWKNIRWSQVQKRINKLQQRIFKSSKENNKKKVKFLQKLLIYSLDAKLLAVKRVTTDNRGRKTAGIDNKLYNTDENKIKLVKKIKIDGKATPIKRIYISKPGKSEKRPLGIPTIEDRAKQYLLLLALEPEWEATFEPNSYGFRPGRNCHDAVVAIFGYIKLGNNSSKFNKYILDADIKGCFDNIDHQYLINKLDTTQQIQSQIKAWLEAGVITHESNKTILENTIGTPQGGIISPFLANVALHGMEEHLKNWISTIPEYGTSKQNRMKQLGIIRYANDFVIIHKDKDIIGKAKITLSNWLKETSKLELNETKTTVTCSTEGFSFLGFRFINILRYNRTRAKIYPDKSAIQNVTKKIGDILRNNRSISSYDIILRLKPIITGWCNYYSISECSTSFNKLDNLTYQMLRSWVFRRDKLNSRTKTKEKYFPSGQVYTYRGINHYDNWVLVGKKKLIGDKTNTIFLPKFSWTKSKNHIKIRSYSSIYDGNEIYWTWRTMNYGDFNQSQKKLLRRQNRLCTWCNSPININDKVETDHITPISKGGSNSYNNLQLLHLQCHIEKTASDKANLNKKIKPTL